MDSAELATESGSWLPEMWGLGTLLLCFYLGERYKEKGIVIRKRRIIDSVSVLHPNFTMLSNFRVDYIFTELT